MHTPAPWIVTGSDRVKYVEARIGGGMLQEVASLMVCEVGDLEANATRIVACVNACEGLTTSYLETLHPSHSSLKRELDIKIANREQAERERDELRVALQKIAALKASDFSGAHDLSAECFVIATTALKVTA